ncbi:hypothetical protein P5P81_03295 [Tritonibacter mobilis]|nr:hypothetical protein [Tritonibacter mobilis]
MSRTVLEIVRSAAPAIGLERPGVLFGSTSRTEIELQRAVIEAADMVLRAHDWRKLMKISTSTGDGSETEFALPSDFLRMPKDADVWSSRTQSPLSRISPEDWLQMDVGIGDFSYGAWTLFGGNMVFRPALSTGETARYWYVSKEVVQGTDGARKERFSDDDDLFVLDDRVLELALIYQWRKDKGLDYAEEMQAADAALSREVESDKGARIVTQRSSRLPATKVAYPGVITP